MSCRGPRSTSRAGSLRSGTAGGSIWIDKGWRQMSVLVTYNDGEPFPGVLGRTSDESSPAWPTPPRAPEGAPNVLIFVLDDVGFGQLSCFGGLVETPVLDRLADNGL